MCFLCVFYMKNMLIFGGTIFCKKVPPPFISAIDFAQNGHEKTLKMWQKSRLLITANLMISGPFCMFFSIFSLYPAHYFQKMPCRNEFIVVWNFPFRDRAKCPLSMGFRVTGSELAIKWSKNTTYHRQHRFQMFLIWTRNESFWWPHRLAVSTVIFEISLKNRFWDSIKMIILEGVWYRQPPSVFRISVLIKTKRKTCCGIFSKISLKLCVFCYFFVIFWTPEIFKKEGSFFNLSAQRVNPLPTAGGGSIDSSQHS